MISEIEKNTIKSIAYAYKVKRILLFGSSASSDVDGNDIDLGVEGVEAKDFFNFYGELLFPLKRSVDLIDLSVDSKFSRLVKKEGISIYG